MHQMQNNNFQSGYHGKLIHSILQIPKNMNSKIQKPHLITIKW